MSAVRPRKLPYKPVIGELENRTELRFLKPLALGAWTYVSGSPTAKARESIALFSAIYSVRGFHTPGRRVTVPTTSSDMDQRMAMGFAVWHNKGA